MITEENILCKTQFTNKNRMTIDLMDIQSEKHNIPTVIAFRLGVSSESCFSVKDFKTWSGTKWYISTSTAYVFRIFPYFV